MCGYRNLEAFWVRYAMTRWSKNGLHVVAKVMAEVCHVIYTSPMALSIKSDEADRLARELTAETGETLTEAVVIALRQRLDREHARHAASMRTRLARLAADVAALRVADDRTPEEIIGYDDTGLPR